MAACPYRVLVERAQERTRIARDVHDVVGHHLSAIRLQAVGARRGTPADADRALEMIAEISATALGDTRRLLGLLRDDNDGDGDGDGVTDLGLLVARLSRQGPRVRLRGMRERAQLLGGPLTAGPRTFSWMAGHRPPALRRFHRPDGYRDPPCAGRR
ncbi:histidine kinase dimerization/phosphoacceptor domain-containing protein [Nonomuraea angiospora]|uniref:histidine kinase dimerization/phosphoacceptor domain-containing protein n=1 Tax=Nonomuraea angiospora TaxID=46172 RepID=UPI0033D2C538